MILFHKHIKTWLHCAVMFIAVCFAYNATGSPIKLIENKGQWDANILFKADIPGGNMFVTHTGFAYSLYDEGALHEVKHNNSKAPVNAHALFVHFKNASANPVVRTYNPSSEYYNFYTGKQQGPATTGARAYQQIILQDIYPHIDLEILAFDEMIKTNFIVRHGGNPSDIKLEYEGANDMRISNNALEVTTSVMLLKEEAPVSYFLSGRYRNEIYTRFVLQDKTVSFAFNNAHGIDLDENDSLIIDPNIVFGTFSGSTADNFGYTATFDKDGNAFAGGIVFATGFPVTAGAFQMPFNGGDPLDAFFSSSTDIGILKFSDDGRNLLYATYIGGMTGNENPHSIICDAAGQLYIMGSTSSIDFPVSSNAFDTSYNGNYDIFIFKLSADGKTMVASTFLGGTDLDGINGDQTAWGDKVNNPTTYNYGDFYRGEILLDNAGNVLVASTTRSADFPVKNAFQGFGGKQDGCIIRMDASLQDILSSSFIGGTETDAAFGVATDNLGNIFVTGGTASVQIQGSQPPGDPFGFKGGSTDGFIVKLSATGSRIRVIYLGTPSYDQSFFVQTDKDNNVYVTGQTTGNYPVTGDVFSEAGGKQFISIYNNTLTAMPYSTVFGTGDAFPDVSPSAFLVDDCNNICFSGWGGSSNRQFNTETGTTRGLTTTLGAFQRNTDGSDFYLVIFKKKLKSLSYATFYGGGSRAGEHVDGGTSRFDKKGVIYQSVCAGCGGFSDFPTTVGAWSRTNKAKRPNNPFQGGCNNALFKFDLYVPNNPPVLRDSVIIVNATDSIGYRFTINDNEGDSIYAVLDGNATGIPNGPIINLSYAKPDQINGVISWKTRCEQVSPDTFYINFNLIDNGCLLPESTIARIKVVINPPPVPSPPFLYCLQRNGPDALVVKWQSARNIKYFSSFTIAKKQVPASFDSIVAVNPYQTDQYTDTKAFDHATNNYCYALIARNVCNILSPDSSRIVCSISEDTDSVYFTNLETTYTGVYALDTVTIEHLIADTLKHDSVFIRFEGNAVGHPNTVALTSFDSSGAARIEIKYRPDCSQVNDTVYIQYIVQDNECPTPRAARGKVGIVVWPLPGDSTPSLFCLKYINPYTLRLRWPVVPHNRFFSYYNLIKTDPDNTRSVLASSLKQSDTEIIDSNAFDHIRRRFCYTLVSYNVCNVPVDTGASTCSIRTAADYPPGGVISNVTVEQDAFITVSWKQTLQQDIESYRLYRQNKNGGGRVALGEFAPAQIKVEDKNVMVDDESYCYTLNLVNDCGLESQQSKEACSILLKGKSEPFENKLNWNRYTYWETPENTYQVFVKTPLMQDFSSPGFTSPESPVFTDDKLDKETGLYTYYVQAIEDTKNNNPLISTSNHIDLVQKPLLHVPNAYTCNGDGLNDTWNPVLVFVKDFHLQVYNRWGQLVYETVDKHGTFKVSSGVQEQFNEVFVYVITYTGFDGSAYQEHGNFTMLK